MSPKRQREIAAEARRLRLAGRATENDEQLEAIEFRLRLLLAEVLAAEKSRSGGRGALRDRRGRLSYPT